MNFVRSIMLSGGSVVHISMALRSIVGFAIACPTAVYAGPFLPMAAYREAATNIVIDGKGGDWAAIPSVADPQDHPLGNNSLDIKRVAIAVRDNDLLLLIETWSKPMAADWVYWANLELLGDQNVDVQFAFNPTDSEFLYIFEENQPVRTVYSTSVADVVVDDVVEIRIHYAALRSLLGASQQPLFAPGNLKPWITVSALTYKDGVAEYAPDCAAYRLSTDGVMLDSLPITGLAVPELAVFDQAMTNFMKDYDLWAGTLAVMRNGQLVLRRGYGWADPYHKHPVGPEAIMQVGSISKHICLAVMRQLERDGRINLEAKVYPFLGLPPATGAILDPRMTNITVRQLMEHTSGLPRDASYARQVALALGLNHSATAADTWRWALSYTMLNRDPGTGYEYANFGFHILGAVAEKAAGTNYAAYLATRMVTNNFCPTLATGRSREADRDPRETWYDTIGLVPDDADISNTNNVRWPNGGVYEEAIFGPASMVASAPDMTRFFQRWWMNGQPRDNSDQEWVAYGTQFGFAVACQFLGKVNVIALFNKRAVPLEESGGGTNALHIRLRNAVNSITNWPANPDLRDRDVNGVPDGLQHAMTTWAGDSVRLQPLGSSRQAELLRDPARNDVSFQVQESPDLLTWTTIATSEFGLPFTGSGYVGGEGSGPGVQTVRFQAQQTGERRFLRLRSWR